jgi:hypothetical protein
MAMVYSFTEEQYPLMPTGLRIFWAGEGAGETREAMMRLYVEWFEGDADAGWLSEGRTTRLEQERFLVAGIDLGGTWQELDFEEEGIVIDFEPDVEGVQPITYGSLVMSICYVNEQKMPEIAMDANFFEPEPIPESGDMLPAGHETSRFRSMIYWNGLWTTSDEYLRNTYGFEEAGDFIMRLLIDAQVDETGASPAAGCTLSDDWNALNVSPTSTTEGTRQRVLVTGDYNFPSGSTLALDSKALLSVNANSNCGIEGFVDPSTPAGTYDVVVTSADVSRTIPGAFTIEKKGGCVTVGQNGRGLLWLIPLFAVALLVRRR